jgi:hypothetical protein
MKIAHAYETLSKPEVIKVLKLDDCSCATRTASIFVFAFGR